MGEIPNHGTFVTTPEFNLRKTRFWRALEIFIPLEVSFMTTSLCTGCSPDYKLHLSVINEKLKPINISNDRIYLIQCRETITEQNGE